jgi:hypothetical protein
MHAAAASSSHESSSPTAGTYIGLFLTTLSLLQLELFLTRIFSVTMWYHFAFMAISLAMFGLAAGAVIVEIRPTTDPHRGLERSAFWFAVASVISFAIQVWIPVNPDLEVWTTGLSFVLIAIPFVCAGVVICLALTRFPAHTGALYAADLAGSAAGCLLTIPILNHLHAPSAVVLNAGIAMLAVAAFAMPRRAWYSLAGAVALAVFGLANASGKWIDIQWMKGARNAHDEIYERWNALSRVAVYEMEDDAPFGWGLSPAYKTTRELDQLNLNIDSAAGTVITEFDGDVSAVEHLKHDVTALAHYLRVGTSVFVIGVGGGRDILTALAFGQTRVVGAEINPNIIEVLTSRFAEYSGRLHEHPSVVLINDEARSTLERSDERFGIIQASLIDTWAASSAGAYVLTENGLYTTDAWRTFLDRLTPDGILTMSRWYDEQQPAETLRLASLASGALMDVGVDDPRRHIMIVRRRDVSTTGHFGVATILVCRRPFTEMEVDRITTIAREMDFTVVLSPHEAERPEFASVSARATYQSLIDTYPLNVAAPTDDTPFFFHMLRASDLVKASTYRGMNEMNLKAMRVLGSLLGIVTLLSLAAIVFPLVVRGRVRSGASVRLMIYFAAIGLAFMMVEIGQLERLIVFLGHPIYGLTVVIFTLLVASSLGSLCVNRAGAALWALPVVLLGVIVLGPALTRGLTGASTLVRILVSAALLFPCGFLMGMAYPAGMKTAASTTGVPSAWYWAINGCFSVIASVLAVVIAVFWGVTATLFAGLAIYLIALAALASERAARSSPTLGSSFV